MSALAWVAVSGALAGAMHVVTGVDHLAALLPLSVGRRFRAFGAGARWGLGHSLGVLLIGLLALLLRDRLDLRLVEAWGERLVGAMLVGLGLWGLRTALRVRVHAHAHHHGEAGEHLHVHAHLPGAEAHDALSRHHGHAAFAAGTLHGVAGTAHLLGVLPALALPSLPASATYLLAFALGTVLAMGSFAGLVGAGSARWAGSGPGRLRLVMGAASVATIVVGLAWLVLAVLPGSASPPA